MKNTTVREMRVNRFTSNNKMDSLYEALLHKYGYISFIGGDGNITVFPAISYLSDGYDFHNKFFATKEKLRAYINKEMVNLGFKDSSSEDNEIPKSNDLSFGESNEESEIGIGSIVTVKKISPRRSWATNVTEGKEYLIEDVYGSNVIFKDDNGNNINGHGINRSSLILVEKKDEELEGGILSKEFKGKGLYFCKRCESQCHEIDREGNCRNCNPDAFISMDKAKQERKENISRGEKWEETKKANSIEKRKLFEGMDVTDAIINRENNSLDIVSSNGSIKQIPMTEELDETFRRMVGVPFTKMRDGGKVVDASKEKGETTSDYEDFLYLVLNDDIKVINEYGCSVYTDGNQNLQYAPLLNSGVRDTEYIIVDSPQDQGFLDLVNEKCGTNYRMSDFEGIRGPNAKG